MENTVTGDVVTGKVTMQGPKVKVTVSDKKGPVASKLFRAIPPAKRYLYETVYSLARRGRKAFIMRRRQRALKQSPNPEAVHDAINAIGYHVAMAVQKLERAERNYRLWSHYGDALAQVKKAKGLLLRSDELLEFAKRKTNPW
jgi:hypothetical protein